MPGVPPDAIAQVKKGLKGLFSRKKRDKYQGAGASSSASPSNGTNLESGSTRLGLNSSSDNQYFPPPPNSKPPQLSEPAIGKPVDFYPSAPSNNFSSTQEAAPAIPSKPPAEGMSATSGPMTDHLGGFAGVGSPVASPITEKGQEFTGNKVEAPNGDNEGMEPVEARKLDGSGEDELANEPPPA